MFRVSFVTEMRFGGGVADLARLPSRRVDRAGGEPLRPAPRSPPRGERERERCCRRGGERRRGDGERWRRRGGERRLFFLKLTQNRT